MSLMPSFCSANAIVSRSESYTPTLPLYCGSHSIARGLSALWIRSSGIASRRYEMPVEYTTYGTEYWDPTS